MLKNKNKNKNKVNSLDSSTLDYYNEDMSKKAVGKLIQNARGISQNDSIEGVRAISRDEYHTYNGTENNNFDENNHNDYDKEYNGIYNSKNGNHKEDELEDFIQNNQSINNSNKKFDTSHKNTIKEQLQKLTTTNNANVSEKTKSLANTYIHTDIQPSVNNKHHDKPNNNLNHNNYDNNINNRNSDNENRNDKKNPQTNNINKKSNKPNKFQKPTVKNNSFHDDDYFATLRTNRLSTDNIELDYENLPYSTTQKHPIKKQKPDYMEESVAKTADKHIEKYNEAKDNNDTLIELVRHTTQEIEKQQIKNANQEKNKTGKKNNSPRTNQGPKRNSNPRGTAPMKPVNTNRPNQNTGLHANTQRGSTTTKYNTVNNQSAGQKPRNKPNPTLAFIRISTFLIMILLIISLANTLVKNSSLQSKITSLEIELKNYESLNQQNTELRLEIENLKEQLSGATLPIDGTNDNSTDETTNNTVDDESTSSNTNTLPTEYTVQAGDNLVKISDKFYNDKDLYYKIKEANNLTDDNIQVGQVLIIPAQ